MSTDDIDELLGPDWGKGGPAISGIEAMQAEIERLRAALKPFATVAKHYAPYPADMTDIAVDYPFKLADLHAAAVAFEQNAQERTDG